MHTDVVTKGEFAQMSGVSAGRVSQWISEGKISDDALVGQGRMAKIRVSAAREQLKLTRDVGQSLGNGIRTRLGDTPSQIDTISDQIAAAKLEQARITTRRMREEDRANAGRYVLAQDVRRATSQAVGAVLDILEGSLGEVANEIAARFEVPQRDVVHLLNQQFRKARARAQAQLASRASALPETVEDVLEDEEETEAA